MSFWIPRKEPPITESRKGGCSISGALQLSLKIPSQRTSRFFNGSLRRGASSPKLSNTLFLQSPSKWAPSISPAGFPRREKFHLQGQWFIHSFIYLFISVGVPIAEPSHNRRGIIHQAEPLYTVRLNTIGKSPGIPEGAVGDRLTHCHSSLRHGTYSSIGDCFSRFTPLDLLCFAQQGHLS